MSDKLALSTHSRELASNHSCKLSLLTSACFPASKNSPRGLQNCVPLIPEGILKALALNCTPVRGSVGQTDFFWNKKRIAQLVGKQAYCISSQMGTIFCTEWGQSQGLNAVGLLPHLCMAQAGPTAHWSFQKQQKQLLHCHLVGVRYQPFHPSRRSAWD